MKDTIVITGDRLQFEPMFGPRKVTVPVPAVMAGSGRASIGGKPVCIVGDEAKLVISAFYDSQPYAAGQGLIKIILLPDEMAPTVLAGAPVLLKGRKFMALFMPTVPASGPSGADTMLAPTPGQGSFVTTETAVKAG